MLTRAYPECGHGSVFRIQEAGFTRLDYFLCDACGLVWYTPIDEPAAVPTVLMPGR